MTARTGKSQTKNLRNCFFYCLLPDEWQKGFTLLALFVPMVLLEVIGSATIMSDIYDALSFDCIVGVPPYRSIP